MQALIHPPKALQVKDEKIVRKRMKPEEPWSSGLAELEDKVKSELFPSVFSLLGYRWQRKWQTLRT